MPCINKLKLCSPFVKILKSNHRFLNYQKCKPPLYEVTLMAHGECEMDASSSFSGWLDCKLTAKGVSQARTSGAMLESEGMNYHIVYTSELDRAQHTVRLLLDSLLVQPRVFATWRLNDRHFGDLTGFSRHQMALVHGEKDLSEWVDKYEGSPPAIKISNPFYKKIIETATKKRLVNKLPNCESQKMVTDRVAPYWKEIIVPSLKMYNKVIIVAHDNTLRAILKGFGDISDEEVMTVNVPAGIPITFALDSDFLITKSNKSIVYGGTFASREKLQV